MKSTENKSTSSCHGSHRDTQIAISKPAADDVSRRTGNHAGNSGFSSDIWMDIHPFRHCSLCMEEGSKYTSYCCLQSRQTAGVSEPLTVVLVLCCLPSGNGFSWAQVWGTWACPSPGTSCHLPKHPWGCSQVTWDLPGYCSLLSAGCTAGWGQTALLAILTHVVPCKVIGEPVQSPAGEYPQNVSASCHSITERFIGGMG